MGKRAGWEKGERGGEEVTGEVEAVDRERRECRREKREIKEMGKRTEGRRGKEGRRSDWGGGSMFNFV
jgi:hypothetical protein